MPEYLERRYDRRARLCFAAMTLFLNIFVDSAGVLYAGALVWRLLFPGVPLWLIAAGLGRGRRALYRSGRAARRDRDAEGPRDRAVRRRGADRGGGVRPGRGLGRT